MNEFDGLGGKEGGREQQLSIDERKTILAKLVRREIFSRQFRVGDKLQAIDLYNKMENLYKQTITVEHEVIHTFIFQLPDGTKFTPGLLPEKTSINEPAITTEVSIVK